MTLQIAAVINELKEYSYAWDSGASPLPRLINEILKQDITALKYLLYHVAARALPCWEANCDIERPRYTINLIKDCLEQKKPLAFLADVSTPRTARGCRKD